MKTEEFDDAIRQKLESINHTYTDGDVEKVFQHVQKGRRLPWKGFHGSWLIYSAAAAVLVAFTTLLVFLPYKENTKQTVVKSLNNNAEKPIMQEKADSENFSNLNNLKSAVAEKPGSAIILPASRNHEANNNQVVSQTAETKTQIVKKQPTKTQFHNSENNTDLIINIKTGVPEQSQMITIEQPNNKSNAEPEVISETLHGKATTLPQSNDKITIAELTENGKIPETAPPTGVVADTSRYGNQKDIKAKDSIPIATKLGFATTFRFSGQRVGMGIAGDLLVGEHLGFTAGLTYNFLKEEQFQDKQDLYGHKPPDFNHHIHDHLNNKEQVTDITIQSQLIQLPLAVNYYIPLKQNFYVRMSLGTDLDLYLKQNLHYNYHTDTMHFDNQQFLANGEVTVFNNLLFSAGIGKRWNHFVLNIEPYYSQALSQVYYKPKETEFGVGMRLEYSF